MTNKVQRKQLWIGLVEVRPLPGGSAILGDTKGAFVNIVTWASDVDEYNRKTHVLIEDLGGLFICEVIDPGPVDARTSSQGSFDSETEDMISRAHDNLNAIIYGTFHTFDKDDS